MPSKVEHSFAGLSLRDVLDARDAYHFHLLNQPHVVATAVGRYLVRKTEADKAPPDIATRLKEPPGTHEARTLEGSVVKPWSWPCVLVFVDYWLNAKEIAENPEALVPRRLFLPDGRVIPTCVVYAPPASQGPSAADHLSFPTALVGGGYVVSSQVQGQTHVGSIGCLVTDGDKTYALTNGHVVGQPGRKQFTMVNGTYLSIGVSAPTSVKRRPFTEVYPGYAGTRVEVAVDAGLIDIDDLTDWTTQVFGIGQLGEPIDMSVESLSLDMIGTQVEAFGAASGHLFGELLAFFYRYRTVGGVEYVGDALIGPAGDEPLATRPGDSGTIWGVRHKKATQAKALPELCPLAMQWGGHLFLEDGERKISPYALATFFSNVCRSLDVEIVRDWNVGHELYWGQVGHYTTGAKACELVQPADLRAFFMANQQNIAFDLDAIEKGKYKTPDGTIFYPLADVPDQVWKHSGPSPRAHEGPNHFADMDQVDGHKESLLSKFRDHPDSVDPETWKAFYTGIGATPHEMGLLPFRVAQLYRQIVTSLEGNDADRIPQALCAAGVMAHYVGDACQPLHISQYFDGDPGNPAETGVHSGYETRMVTSKRKEIIDGLAKVLDPAKPMATIEGHHEAAKAVAALMDRTFQNLDPATIRKTWVSTGGHAADMWAALGDQTIACIADGCRTLAMLWSSAWAEAKADAPPAKAVDTGVLSGLYTDKGKPPDQVFVPSYYLTEYVTAGIW